MTTRIAMWSGPRNLSTALMYAFAARGDCTVSDEPLYAVYLARSGVRHPMQAAVLAAQPHDPAQIDLGQARATPIWYQKHMTHHLLPDLPTDWLTGWLTRCRHAFLIRHPVRVIASYARKREAPRLDDLGFVQQLRLFEKLRHLTGQTPPVLDSTDLRAAPGPMLRALCRALDIPYTPAMLHWPAGPKPYDGVWAPAWYQAVHASSGFEAAEGPLPPLTPPNQALARAALPAYEALAAHKLRP